MLKLKLQYFGHLMQRVDSLEKTLMLGGIGQQTSLVFFFKPALAPILAFLILHEEIPFNMIIGIVLILCGSMVSLLPGLKALRKEKTAG